MFILRALNQFVIRQAVLVSCEVNQDQVVGLGGWKMAVSTGDLFSGSSIDTEMGQLVNCMLKKVWRRSPEWSIFTNVLDQMLWHLAQNMLACSIQQIVGGFVWVVEVMKRVLLKKFNYSNLLFTAWGCFVVVFILLGFYLWSNSREPIQVESDLLTTKGKFFAVGSSSQYSTAFLVEKSGGELVRFTAIPAYTKIIKSLHSSRGKSIEVRHYGELVVECRISGVEYCKPKCFGALECQMKSFRAQARALEMTIWTVFIVGVCALFMFAYKNKTSES